MEEDPEYRNRVLEQARAAYWKDPERRKEILALKAKRRAENPEKFREQARKCVERNRQKILDRQRARYRDNPTYFALRARAWKYDMLPEQIRGMYDTQGGRCACCLKTIEFTSQNTHVDHDHRLSRSSNSVRGIVFKRCNLRLAVLDDPEWVKLGQAYLARFAIRRILEDTPSAPAANLTAPPADLDRGEDPDRDPKAERQEGEDRVQDVVRTGTCD